MKQQILEYRVDELKRSLRDILQTAEATLWAIESAERQERNDNAK